MWLCTGGRANCGGLIRQSDVPSDVKQINYGKTTMFYSET